MSAKPPTLDEISALRDSLAEDLFVTPVLRCPAIETAAGSGTEVWGKLEFLQRTGTFKARGALSNLLQLGKEQLRAGVTAVSAGNHAIATAFAAKAVGTSAKVVMLGSANPLRIDVCRSYGAEVIIVDDVHEAFDVAKQVERDEGRFFVHPFEGHAVATGTGTLGVEICEQVPAFDAVIVPIGGGGLMGGVSNAIKLVKPDIRVIGVEPVGANSMHRSFAAGKPQSIDKVRTIADSLGAPYALPYSFELCRKNVDELVEVTDDDLRRTMGFLFSHLKIAVEPACAASTAALLGPLKEQLAGQRVVLVFCGSNIDWASFAEQAKFED